ncbi:MAG: cobalamin B12-binding domain-containing protein [Endomicrobium sp.]|nr:cobalamin B12-binding domain-containing protein [Endomicrobium sp.]
MKNTLLIVPFMKDKYLKKELGNKEFLGIQYLAAMLDSKGFDCDIVNAHYMQWDETAISRNVDINSYKFIGISCVSQRCYPFTKKLVKFLREKDCTAHICLGGGGGLSIFSI